MFRTHNQVVNAGEKTFLSLQRLFRWFRLVHNDVGPCYAFQSAARLPSSPRATSDGYRNFEKGRKQWRRKQYAIVGTNAGGLGTKVPQRSMGGAPVKGLADEVLQKLKAFRKICAKFGQI